ncbi:valine--tRNA ligase [candidate division NPL-UPA2 bacterium]|nr:valine--tRNA ligase [candidate division NPL-UPA2 bacterium]
MEKGMEGRDIPTKYNPRPVEERWYQFWEEKGYFQAEVNKKKRPYCIVIPPPNITGSLHMGHALNNTLQDILIRWKRMQGYNALWIPGVDHAGIATQNVVEKELVEAGINRHELGREKFVEKVWEWKAKYGETIIQQLKRLGCACDWRRSRFTLDESCSRAVREEFVRLHQERLIYQANYIINWCPRCQTALSDIEVEHQEINGKLYYINYPLESGQDQLTVATTRPETMLGDVAVAVHPDDKRYQRFIGKTLILPLVGRQLPIIIDERIDPSFGTGAVKITPAHDPDDFEIGVKQKLSQVVVIDETGKMTKEAGNYAGMDRYQCREEVLKDLKTQRYLVKIEDYIHSVGHCYRCHTAIEPLISEQWFVKMKELARPAIRAVKSGRITFFPHRWTKVYLNWMENIRDWCISRQIWWGHQLPVWHCRNCQHLNVSQEEPNSCEKCGSSDLEQDQNVLDTWFSSALWPFSTLGWPEETEDLAYFYPTSTLVTGHEIIYFWVARMIMMGLKFRGDIPFHEVYIHGIVRDREGRKMSKSLGNVIDPLETMEEYGTDALRLALAQASTLGGQDIFLSRERLEGTRNFANKLWNVSRFILLNTEDFNFKGTKQKSLKFDEDDEYIISRLNQIIREVTNSLSAYKFSEASQAIYEFLWHEFCDWYVELSKLRLPVRYSLCSTAPKVLYAQGCLSGCPEPLNGTASRQSEGLQGDKDEEERRTAQWVLHYVLRNVLKLLHPYMPFITEEIWQHLAGTEGSIMLSAWPRFLRKRVNEKAIGRARKKYEVITAERRIRSGWNIPLKRKLEHVIKPVNREEKEILERSREKFTQLLPSSQLTIDENYEPSGNLISEVTPSGTTIFVNLGEAVDLEREREKHRKEIAKIEEELKRVDRKLSSADFLEKAPQEIVEKEKNKRDEYETRISQLLKTLKKK